MEERFDLSGSFPLEWSRRRWDLSLSDAHHLWKIWKWHLTQRNYMVKGLLWPVAVGGCRPSPHIYTDMQLPKVPFRSGITLGASGPAGPGRKSVRKRGMEQEGGAGGLGCVFQCYRAFWNTPTFRVSTLPLSWKDEISDGEATPAGYRSVPGLLKPKRVSSDPGLTSHLTDGLPTHSKVQRN